MRNFEITSLILALAANLQAAALAPEWRPVNAFAGGPVVSVCRSGPVLYASTLKAGIYSSADAGATWQSMDPGSTRGLEITHLSCSETAVFAATSYVVHRHVPGSTWSALPRIQPADDIFFIRKFVHGPGSTYILASPYNSPIYLTRNDGVTWSRAQVIMPGNPYPLSLVDFTVRGTVVYAATRDTVYVTPELGQPWTVASVFPPGAVPHRLEAGESGLWAATSKGLLHCSWALLDAGGRPAWTFKPARGIPANRSQMTGLLEQAGGLWVGTVDGAFYSRDLGESFRWAAPASGDSYGNVGAMVWDGSGVMMATARHGVLKADTAGTASFGGQGMRNRTVTSVVTHLGEIHAMVEDLGWYVSRDGGQNWDGPMPGLRSGLGNGRFFSILGRLHLAYGSGIFRYDPVRRALDPLGLVGRQESVSALIWHRDRLYAGTRERGVFQSRDTGRTWERPLVSIQEYLNLGHQQVLSLASNGVDLYATAMSGGSGNLYRLDPDSLLWRNIRNNAAGGDYEFLSVQALGDTLLTGGRYNVNRSVDGGATWLPVAALPGTDNYVQRLHYSEGVLLAAGTKAAAISRDRGLTWEALSGLSASVTCGVPIAHGMLLGTDGLSMMRYFPAGAPPDGVRRLARVPPAAGRGYRLIILPETGRLGRFAPPGTVYNLLGQRHGIQGSRPAQAPLILNRRQEAP